MSFSLLSLFFYTGLTCSDEGGYLLYCPCMGRLGNQIDYFLGALGHSMRTGRTLVLPPFISYPEGFTDFEDFFDISPIKSWIIRIDDFMAQSEILWPEKVGYCAAKRMANSEDKKSCNMFVGNPYDRFWHHYGIEEFDKFHPNDGFRKFDSLNHPVIALQGPSFSFPVREVDSKLSSMLKLNRGLDKRADDLIATFKANSFLAVHLRIGKDWKKACNVVDEHKLTRFMGSEQCTGFRYNTQLGIELCFPTKAIILRSIRIGLRHIDSKTLFIASDVRTFPDGSALGIDEELTQEGYDVQMLEVPADPLLDIAVASKADLWVGFCLSSFSRIIRRLRDNEGKPSEYFGFGVFQFSEDKYEL